MAIEVTEDMELVLYRFTKKSWVRHTFSYINLSNLFSRIVKNRGQMQDAKLPKCTNTKKYFEMKKYYWQFCDTEFVKSSGRISFHSIPNLGKAFFVKLIAAYCTYTNSCTVWKSRPKTRSLFLLKNQHFSVKSTFLLKK